MPIAPLLQRFVDDELALAPAVIQRTLAGTLQLLRDTQDGSLAPPERAHHLALAEALQRQAPGYQATFVEALRALVMQDLNDLTNAGLATAAARSGGLELMDESRVEVDIEISRAMQRIDTTAEWELRELQMFTSTLIGQTHVSAESNPFRPLVYATALWQAACAVTAVQVERATLLRVSAGVTAGLLKNAWAAACTRLESQGIEPGVYRTVLLTPAASAERGPSPLDASQPGALAGMLSRMPSGTGELRLGIGHVGGYADGSTGRPGAPAVTPEFEEALQCLDELLRHLPMPAPAPVAAGSAATGTPAARLTAQRAALVASAPTSVDRQVVELLSRVFDSMLSDARLPAAFVTVVACLQASALRVALRDAAMFESKQHAVWALLDRIGEAACSLPQPGDPRAAAALSFCQTMADELARAPAPDATLYRRALERLDTFLAESAGAQLRAAQPAVAALQLAERRELLEQHLSQRLVDQMVPMRTSPGIRRFVAATWAKVLAESVLHFGEQHETTHAYIKLVDDLLWSVQLPDHPQSRHRLLSLLPRLLERLRAGMALIALPAADQERVLDELMAIHTEALRPGGRNGGGALLPETIVQRMRDEDLEPPPFRTSFSDSVIDLGSMETVPAEVFLVSRAPSGDEMAQRVDALRPFDRVRLFIQGGWCRLQLLWCSDAALFYLFAGESPDRTHSVTRRALERLAAEGLLQPLEVRTLVQRALDAVMRDIARPH